MKGTQECLNNSFKPTYLKQMTNNNREFKVISTFIPKEEFVRLDHDNLKNTASKYVSFHILLGILGVLHSCPI